MSCGLEPTPATTHMEVAVGRPHLDPAEMGSNMDSWTQLFPLYDHDVIKSIMNDYLSSTRTFRCMKGVSVKLFRSSTNSGVGDGKAALDPLFASSGVRAPVFFLRQHTSQSCLTSSSFENCSRSGETP